MKIYFLSSQPCALTLNGVFFGVTDDFERFAELSLSDRIFVRFSPEGTLPLGFFLTEEIRSRPPAGCDVYLLKEGIAVYARDFPPADFSLRPVCQKREGERLATLYFQGKLQLSLQTPEGFFNANIPPSFASASLEFYRDFLLLRGENILGVYDLRCTPLLVEQIADFSFTEKGFDATLPLSDSLRRRAECSWELSEKGCVLQKYTLRQEEENAPIEGLLAYAFFETVLLKGDYAALLCEEIRSEAEQIAAFLGEFTAVTLTKNPLECGLVRKKAEGLFVLDYFSVEIKAGKISDVKG